LSVDGEVVGGAKVGLGVGVWEVDGAEAWGTALTVLWRRGGAMEVEGGRCFLAWLCCAGGGG